ncbi:MAG: tetraacyldisaccharide 4'-kinase [Deltaproteobacteria bacterium]|nr:tetraacyldisaccharide 4'-kinase [Deltaproteobacteria bacterium]
MSEPGRGGLAHIILYCLSLAYGLAVSVRLRLYGLGILSTKRLPCKVISIGNITAGGSGKTPMAIHVAGLLKKRGERVTVLSRGYGRASSGVLTVSDGKNILLGPREAGDEPYLMATRLKGVPVVVGEDRAEAGLFAIRKFNPACIILDDGFQHLRLERDLNILLVDAQAGFGNGFLLPRGILREPLSAVKRASITMVKGSGLGDNTADIIHRSGKSVVKFNYKPNCLTHLSGNQTLPLTSLKGKRVIAIAGIANPESFFSTLRRLNAEIVKTIIFPDHHAYSKADILKIEALKKAAPDADIIITTEKDGVKLKGLVDRRLGIYALSIDVWIEDRMEFEKAFSFLKEDR